MMGGGEGEVAKTFREDISGGIGHNLGRDELAL